jgi:prolyl 4-hydroxylase
MGTRAALWLNVIFSILLIGLTMPTFSKLCDLPQLSELGFLKLPVPEAIFNQINAVYEVLKPFSSVEHFDNINEFITNEFTKDPAYLMSLDRVPELRDNILNVFHGVLFQWVKTPIKPLCVYGIRSYQRGSVLNLHVDRLETHHVSAIICVDKKVDDDQDWALDICDHFGRWHKVYINAGEMILYESAICQHARLKPLAGDYFNNIFLHYSLVDYDYQPIAR